MYSDRLLDPSIYKKIFKTRELIGKKIPPSEFLNRGGVDLDTYNALQQRWQEQQQLMEDHKKEVIDKYGSLKAAPLSLSPFETIDPVIGNKNALVLLTDFKDIKHIHEPAEFEGLLFDKGNNKSMRDYFLEASWNRLDITGKISDQWFTVSNNCTDYVDEAVQLKYPLSRKLVKETLLQARNTGFNFKPFAINGEIELLIVVYAGYGLDFKPNIKKHIRPHQGKLKEPLEVQKGIFAQDYALIPELPFYIGCFCHEMGHMLGLPDLYNEVFSPMIGSWCLMSYGDHIECGKTPAHPSAWCKVHLGWRKPKVIHELPQNMEIPAVIDDNGVIYKIEVPGNEGEYFLLENRQKKGFDLNLPDSGLLIWHIDETKCVHKNPNSDPKHPGILLEQSDGKNELNSDYSIYRNRLAPEDVRKDAMGDEGDAYPGKTINRAFDENSNPNSNSLKGDQSGISITSISDSDNLMKAKIGAKYGSTALKDKSKKSTRNITPYMIQKYLSIMSSRETDNAYEKGFKNAELDLIERLKDDNGLDLYSYGYILGYQNGYKSARKLIKNKKINKE